MRKLFIAVITGFVVLLLSCGSHKDGGRKDSFTIPDSLDSSPENVLQEEVTGDIIDNLASPVEIAGLLNELGIPYSNSYLASPDWIENMNSDIQKAYGLGMYGADLGYQAMYGQNASLLDYISNIKRLADDLLIGQYFDFNLLKRLAGNKNNLDSLMFVSVHSFNEMDNYLYNTQRGEISTLIISGLWLEGIYLACQVEKKDPDAHLKERIGEQKIVLEDLFVLLDRYKSNTEVSKFRDELESLNQLYDQVEIKILPGEPETVEQDGRLVIIQHEESEITYSDDLLQKIIDQTSALRNKLLYQ